MKHWRIRELRTATAAELEGMAEVLVDCVEGGASVSFMPPLTRERAREFWRGVAESVERGQSALWIAEDAHGVCGTVQVAWVETENQPHRAEVRKMLVHRRARRSGIAAAMLQAAEQTARAHGRTLLVLDTASADAERIYQRCGWIRVGVIPGYSLSPQRVLCDVAFYFRNLER